MRRRSLRAEWRTWSLIVGFWVAALAAVFLVRGGPQLAAAGLVGAMSALLVFGWMLGGDVRSLTWLWGRIGEQQTEAVLAKLPSEWRVEHDIRHPNGNWDHVVVGPAGLYLLDSKRLNGTAFAGNDSLRAGRTRFTGGRFRGDAVAFGDVIAPLLGRRPWVNAVVVVWDDFPQREHEDNRVTYVAGETLVDWLCERPTTLDAAQRDRYTDAVRDVRAQLAAPPAATQPAALSANSR
jgi:hypothetical protein